jgi:hypothetical protein
LKTFLSTLLGIILGVLLMLLLRPAPAPPPPAVVCPSPAPCPTCGELSHRPQRPRPRPPKKDPPTEPLPEMADEEDARRDALREWFAAHARSLTACRPDGEPRRQLLMQMKLEPDGSIADAAPIGAADLPAATASCVVAKVRELRVPPDLLRGRETALIHLGI